LPAQMPPTLAYSRTTAKLPVTIWQLEEPLMPVYEFHAVLI
jgi:hypothetical protein